MSELKRIVRAELEAIVEEGIRKAQEREAAEEARVPQLEVAKRMVQWCKRNALRHTGKGSPMVRDLYT